MMRNVGMDYGLFDKVDYYPLEIQKLLDIVSINPNYLLKNNFLKKDFIDWLSVDNVISDKYIVHVSPDDDLSSTRINYNPEQFNEYIQNLIGNFIYDMLAMRTADGVPVYRTLATAQLAGSNGVHSPYETYGEFEE